MLTHKKELAFVQLSFLFICFRKRVPESLVMPGMELALGNGAAKALGVPHFASSISQPSERKPKPHTRWKCTETGPCSLAIINQGDPKEENQAVFCMFLI